MNLEEMADSVIQQMQSSHLFEESWIVFVGDLWKSNAQKTEQGYCIKVYTGNDPTIPIRVSPWWTLSVVVFCNSRNKTPCGSERGVYLPYPFVTIPSVNSMWIWYVAGSIQWHISEWSRFMRHFGLQPFDIPSDRRNAVSQYCLASCSEVSHVHNDRISCRRLYTFFTPWESNSISRKRVCIGKQNWIWGGPSKLWMGHYKHTFTLSNVNSKKLLLPWNVSLLSCHLIRLTNMNQRMFKLFYQELEFTLSVSYQYLWEASFASPCMRCWKPTCRSRNQQRCYFIHKNKYLRQSSRSEVLWLGEYHHKWLVTKF